MPLYEYVCAACGATFERLTPLADAHKTQECPACGKSRGKRILSAPSLGSPGGSGGSCGSSGFG